MSIRMSLDLIETNRQIQQLILLDLIKELNSKIPKTMSRITSRLRIATFNYLKTTDTYISLVHGKLAGHFGIPSIRRAANIDGILQTIVDNMVVEYIPVSLSGRNFNDTNGFKLQILLSSFSDILSLPQAQVFTGTQFLDWLRWLLTAGDKIIISEYDVHLSVGRGRSGLGIMVGEKGGSWRVPPAYAGTRQDNWFTRALLHQSYISIIENIIKKELQEI